jgi:hypothetical protein
MWVYRKIGHELFPYKRFRIYLNTGDYMIAAVESALKQIHNKQLRGQSRYIEIRHETMAHYPRLMITGAMSFGNLRSKASVSIGNRFCLLIV